MSVEFLLRSAIRQRRLITFQLHGLPRRAEPHDYGVINGVEKLFCYQVGGRSRSGKPFGWRWAIISEMSDLKVLDETFPGGRAVPSGRHIEWDVLMESVSRR